MDDPYTILGVARTATKDEIKKAFRKKMKMAHPDRDGGDHDEAQRLNRAWDVLGDDQRRAKYDETGEISSGGEPSLDDLARGYLANAFAQMLSDEIDFPPHEDPLAKMIKAMQGALKQYEFEVKKVNSYIKKIDAKQNRVKFIGGGTDLWRMVIDDRKRKHMAHLAKMNEAIQVANRSMEILKEYQGQFSEKKAGEAMQFDPDAIWLDEQIKKSRWTLWK